MIVIESRPSEHTIVAGGESRQRYSAARLPPFFGLHILKLGGSISASFWTLVLEVRRTSAEEIEACLDPTGPARRIMRHPY
jgi:hypothetical protein